MISSTQIHSKFPSEKGDFSNYKIAGGLFLGASAMILISKYIDPIAALTIGMTAATYAYYRSGRSLPHPAKLAETKSSPLSQEKKFFSKDLYQKKYTALSSEEKEAVDTLESWMEGARNTPSTKEAVLKILELLSSIPSPFKETLIKKASLCVLSSQNDVIENYLILRMMLKLSQEENPSHFQPAFTKFLAPSIRDIPPSMTHLLWLDKSQADRGPDFFDRDEPGYRAAMERCLNVIDSVRSFRMNAIWLEFLHNMAVFGVRKTEDNKEMQLDYCPFGGDNWCFPLDRKLITQPSLLYEEWEKERLIDGSLFTSKQGIKSARFEKTDSPFLGVVVTENPAFIQGRFTSLGVSEIEKIFHAFYEEIKESSRLEDRYKAVARCLRKIVVIHAFPYGNLRTSMMLLLILFYQIEAPGLPILEPSYLLGAKRLVEIVEAMQEGTEDFTEKLSYQKRHTP